MEDIKKKVKDAIVSRSGSVDHIDMTIGDLDDVVNEISIFIECEFDKVYSSAERLWDSTTDIIDDYDAIAHLESVCSKELTDLNIL